MIEYKLPESFRYSISMNIRKQIRKFVVEEGLKFIENGYLPFENFNFPNGTKNIYGISREDIPKKIKELSNSNININKPKSNRALLSKKRTINPKSICFNTSLSKMFINKSILKNKIDISRIIVDKNILVPIDNEPNLQLEVDLFNDTGDIINKN